MRLNLIPLIVPASIGFVLGTAGITWTDWQTYAVLALGGIGQLVGYGQGWTECTKKERQIDAIRKRICKKGICAHADGGR